MPLEMSPEQLHEWVWGKKLPLLFRKWKNKKDPWLMGSVRGRLKQFGRLSPFLSEIKGEQDSD